MDEVNINKYLGQLNPILIVPVLSAVVGAILVFVFGFKRPNEPRFQSSSSSDSLKKSKRKANTVKSADNAIQSTKQSNAASAKVNSGKKASDASAVVAGKKGATNDKSNANNNNNINSNNNNTNPNNNINKKKTDEKKSDNGSPAKKVINKKTGKEAQPSANKKQSKASKNNTSNDKDYKEKPADFDDGGWFTVQSKSTKQKNKADESAGNQTNENSSPKPQSAKTNKTAKSAKMDVKQTTPPPPTPTPTPTPAQPPQTQPQPPIVSELTTKMPETIAVEQPPVEPKPIETTVDVPDIVAELVINEVVEKKSAAPAAVSVSPVVESDAIVDNAIAFDELGEWTDIKPDRKKGNKKKSRKD